MSNEPSTGNCRPVFNSEEEMREFFTEFQKSVKEDLQDLAKARNHIPDIKFIPEISEEEFEKTIKKLVKHMSKPSILHEKIEGILPIDAPEGTVYYRDLYEH